MGCSGRAARGPVHLGSWGAMRLDPRGPENIRWGVLREGGSGWGAVAGQPGALSTSGAEERCAWTRGAPRISAGRVLREGGLGWGALAGQPGALSTSEESPDITRA